MNGEAKTRIRGRRMAVLTVALLLTALWLPCLAMGFLPTPTLSFTEKRFLAERPRVPDSWAAARTWPAGVERWLDDRLGFRDVLIGTWARLHVVLFGFSPAELTIVGKEGWLFLGDADAVDHYRGLAPLRPAELTHWRSVVEARRDWLAERGIAYLLVLVPDKHLIYPEYMPDALPRVGHLHPLGQLADSLTQDADLPVLDLRPALLTAKERGRIYHKTDSHWNDRGAYAAYLAIHAEMQKRLPGLSDVGAAPAAERAHRAAGMGLAATVGLTDLYREEVLEAPLVEPRAMPREDPQADLPGAAVLRPLIYQQPESARPRALVFRDSFGNALVPYLAEDFSRTVFVWDRDVDPDVVLEERPDIVIQQIVGRFLGRRPKSLDEVREAKRRQNERRKPRARGSDPT